MSAGRLGKALLPFVFLFVAACPGTPPPPKAPVQKAAPAKAEEKVVWRKSKSGLGFRLSNADAERPDRAKTVRAEPLDAKAERRVLARMPRFKVKAKKKTFAMRAKSIPAPRPGETIKNAFPPKVSSGPPPVVATKSGKLELLRHAPEGDVPVAPNLSITFSEPMVAVTSHGELGRETIPVQLSPEPPGKWRWVGTQTVFFDPKGERFPASTDYRVTVPASAKAASGRGLAEAESWTFSTPTLAIKDAFPERWGDPVDLEPVMFLELNQRIDKNALLSHISVRTGKEQHAVRLATDDEIAKDDDVRGLVQQAEPDRFIAFKPEAPLPKGAHAVIVIASGAPSAEGPKRTEKELTADFRVRGPLKLLNVRCGWYDGCPPLAPWSAQLSNTVDASTFDTKMVTVKPELPGLKVHVSGRYLTIRGQSKGRTTYTVSLSPEIKDVFEQNLEQPATGTVTVGEAEPMLFSEQDSMLVLDPAFDPKLSVYSVNRKTLKVRLYAVKPKDWDAYLKFRQAWDWDGRLTQPPGKLVKTFMVRPKGERDALTETQIDLSAALKQGFGQVIAIVEPPNQPKPRNRWSYREREWVRAWLQVTKLGLTAFKDDRDAYAWVTELSTGAPVGGAEVHVLPSPGGAKTGSDGIAKLKLGSDGDQLTAARGADLIFVPGTRLSGTFSARTHRDTARWFVFDDRQLYKPGERVNVKGWVRLQQAGKNGDLGRLATRGREIAYTVRDPRGAELAKGTTSLDESDGFHLSFDLPKNANTGSASVRLAVPTNAWGDTYTHSFSIEEFRRPEFEVGAQVSEGPHSVGKHAIATVSAKYFAGGGLADADVIWNVTAQDAYFTPPNRSGYHFGKPRRWSWWSSGDDEDRKAEETWKAKTNGEGTHRLRIDFDAVEPAYPRKIDLEARITDVNRQSWSARSDLLVHPSAVTVGIRQQSQLLRAGQNAQLDVIVTDIEGKTVEGTAVKLEMARVDRTWRGRKVQEKLVENQVCEVTSAAEPARCSLPTKNGGLHRIWAKVTDKFGRPSRTELDFYVLGQDPAVNPTVRLDRVDILPDKTEYAGGETAKLLVMAPFAPAEGVLTLRRDGVVHLQRFHLDKRTDTLDVKLDPAWLPNVYARVDLVGERVREGENGEPDPSLPKRPAAASGEATLKIPPTERTLDIDVKPRVKALEPGGSTSISVDVTQKGRPVAGASVALVVVDESVLALAGYDLPDPIAALYPTRSEGVSDFEMRLRIALMRPDTARFELKSKAKDAAGGKADKKMRNGFGNGEGRGYGMKATARPAPKPMASAAAQPVAKAPMAESTKALEEGKPEPEIRMRSNFNPLAAFVPKLRTNARGHAVARVKLPDNLTRYRIMAVAAEGDNRFGSSESDVTARLPLMVRPSAPRFLNFGDTFSLPVVLQNQTVRPMTVDVALRADNAKLFAPNSLRVQVPANDRVEVRFPAAAGEPGTARFQVGAVSKVGVDAAEIELPIWTPATTEAFATYGQIDQNGAISQPVKMPRGVYTEVGQLEITTTSTALQGLTDAVLYLVHYPFDCNEQISSRVLSIAALKDVLGAFKAEGLPPKKVLIASVADDMKKLGQRQHWSGGWDYWRRDRTPDPWVSVHVTHSLVRAKQKGFRVPKNLLAGGMRYLRAIKSHFPPWYPESARRTVRAYSLSVRARNGENVAGEARELWSEAGGDKGLGLDAIGFLLPILDKDPGSAAAVASIRKLIDNRITETAGKAHFVTHFDDSAHVTLASSRRTDGILLEAMIDDQPESDAITKIAKGLLAHRKRGRWLNTQENVFVLLSLDRFFNQYEKVTPDFVARAWLGDQTAFEHAFKGRSTDRQHVDIPLSYLAKAKNASKVVLQKDGAGRLYYRIGMQYVPRDLRPPPAEHGFSVSRLYEGADEASDVKRGKDGTWYVKLGARVRVRVAMVAPARRYHVALVDPIPAGFEPLNPALAMTETVPRDPKASSSKTPWWWSRVWYEHQNLRDERVEAFASLLYGGVYDYTYVARATTPGTFVVPPPKAEEMYDPETFGRGPGDRVIVK